MSSESHSQARHKGDLIKAKPTFDCEVRTQTNNSNVSRRILASTKQCIDQLIKIQLFSDTVKPVITRMKGQTIAR